MIDVIFQRETVEDFEVDVTWEGSDPTHDTVGIAIVAPPARPTVFTPAAWKATPATTIAAGVFAATIVSPLVGAAGAAIPLSPGEYLVYWRVTDNPAVAVHLAGTLSIE